MRFALAMGALALVLAGCSVSEGNEESAGYVSPDGSLTVLDEKDRVKVPTIAGEDLNGDALSLDSYLGKSVIVVNVWGSWCPPCRAEASELVAVDENNPHIQFFGIAVRDTAHSALAFTKEFNITYPNLFDPSGESLLGFAESLPAVALPTTYVIDKQGRLAARIVDTVTETSLLDVIEQVNGGK